MDSDLVGEVETRKAHGLFSGSITERPAVNWVAFWTLIAWSAAELVVVVVVVLVLVLLLLSEAAEEAALAAATVARLPSAMT